MSNMSWDELARARGFQIGYHCLLVRAPFVVGEHFERTVEDCLKRAADDHVRTTREKIRDQYMRAVNRQIRGSR